MSKEEDKQKPAKRPKFLIVVAVIGLIVILLNLLYDTDALPTSFGKKLQSLFELFYPNDTLGILLFSLLILFAVGIGFLNYKYRNTAKKVDSNNRFVWVLAACVIFGLLIAAIAMYA